MNILVDIDDTIADLIGPWINRYNWEYGDNLTKEDIHSWDIYKYVKPECGSKIYSLLTPDIYNYVKPIEDALWGVEQLREIGHRVIFVTSCLCGHMDRKRQWLEENGFLHPLNKVQLDYVVASDKSLVKGDIMIDDRIFNLENNSAFGILFDQPNNRDEYWFPRAKGWKDIIHFMNLYTHYYKGDVSRWKSDNKAYLDYVWEHSREAIQLEEEKVANLAIVEASSR